MSAVEGRTEGGVAAKAASVMRMIRGVVSTVSKKDAERVEPMLRNMAAAVGELSPDLLVGLLSDDAGSADEARVMDAIVSRMTDRTIAHFVSKNVIASNGTPTDRLVEAFQTLVRNPDDRHRLLNLAHDDAAASPFGQAEGFETVWNHVAEKLLTSYSDATFVSEEYARELSGARTKAVDVEQASDDPPERLAVWVDSVAASALRSLDLHLLLDLLRLEQDNERWGTLMAPVVHNLEDLLLVGDFDSAIELTAAITSAAAEGASKERRQHALIAIDMLVAGSMMRHIVTHLLSIDEPSFERVKTMCVSLGEVLVRPLAEALSVEERGRTRERLTAILIAFGPAGRRTIERLKTSPNAAVRRTAIHLMRQFGGVDSLPDLTDLLNDSDSMIQREAVRAILNIGTEKAYRVLEEALATGTERSRDAIMLAISMQRDERATPLFAYILRHIDHRRLTAIYLRAIESLGALRDPEGIAPLVEALGKGEWWAPRRTAALRAASAAALARIGTPEAFSALETAADGSRRIRAVARPFLENRGRAGGERRDGAARPARRRAAAQLRRHAALGAAVLQGPPDHHAQPRIVLGRDSAAAHPVPARRHRPDRRRGDRGRHADRQGGRDGAAHPPAAPERPRAHHHRARRDARRARPLRGGHDGPRASGRRRPARDGVCRHAAHPRRPRAWWTSAPPASWPTSRRSSGCTTRPSPSRPTSGTARRPRASPTPPSPRR